MDTDIIVQPADTYCGYVNPTTGALCLRKAGAGTSHEGSGKCSLHENIPDDKPVVINRKTSNSYLINSIDPKTRHLVSMFLDDPQGLYDLRDIIASLRAAHYRLMEEGINDEDGNLNISNLKDLNSLAKQITSTTESALRLETQTNNLVSKTILAQYTQLFVDTMSEFLPDPTDRARLLERIREGVKRILESSDN